jgi:MSHA biogenesis protein MshM
MYLDHFGLKEFPFALTPDTGFFFNYRDHLEALNVLTVALRAGEGFIKVTGEVGTGKTLLCRKLLNGLDAKFVTAYIPNPFLEPDALRRAVAEELGVAEVESLSQHALIKALNVRLIELAGEGKRVVLCIDEAQSLCDESLEALRLLSNLETEKAKLLHLVLFGQPELDARLETARFRQLRQRITFAHRLAPLDRAGVQSYVAHRLSVAGYNGAPPFSRGAIAVLRRASRGIPRLINVLAHKSLMLAYGAGSRRITPRQVRAAVRDTEGAQQAAARGPWWLLTTLTAAAASAVALILLNVPA